MFDFGIEKVRVLTGGCRYMVTLRGGLRRRYLAMSHGGMWVGATPDGWVAERDRLEGGYLVLAYARPDLLGVLWGAWVLGNVRHLCALQAAGML